MLVGKGLAKCNVGNFYIIHHVATYLEPTNIVVYKITFSELLGSSELVVVSVQGLGILKQKFPTTPVLALTATATISVKEDVVQALGLVNCIVFRQSFNRPNLR